MTVPRLGPEQVTAELARFKPDGSERVLALLAEPTWDGPSVVSDGDVTADRKSVV